MELKEPPKPMIWRQTGETKMVTEFVQRVGEKSGFGTLWLSMSPAERLHAEWMCQGDPLRAGRVQTLRSVEILYRPIQEVLAEDDQRLGND